MIREGALHEDDRVFINDHFPVHGFVRTKPYRIIRTIAGELALELSGGEWYLRNLLIGGYYRGIDRAP